MAKHYIRIDKDATVIHAFCDDFEKPQEGDICINENGERHLKFPLYDENRNYKYKWDGSKTVERIEAEKYNIEIEKERAIQLLKANTIKTLIENDSNYQSIKTQIDNAKNKTELDNISIS